MYLLIFQLNTLLWCVALRNPWSTARRYQVCFMDSLLPPFSFSALLDEKLLDLSDSCLLELITWISSRWIPGRFSKGLEDTVCKGVWCWGFWTQLLRTQNRNIAMQIKEHSSIWHCSESGGRKAWVKQWEEGQPEISNTKWGMGPVLADRVHWTCSLLPSSWWAGKRSAVRLLEAAEVVWFGSLS